jgi:hypothetical protein
MKHMKLSTADAASILIKSDASLPAFKAAGRATLVIRAGTSIAGTKFAKETPVHLPGDLEPGADYCIYLGDRVPAAGKAGARDIVIGGFHFAPGGNAQARGGGDTTPRINPCSIYDLNFRPACPDPRGMAFVEAKNFWGDIYLCAADHLEGGTSQFGVTIADGRDLPQDPAGGRFRKFDYASACAVMKHHGKGLMSPDEFAAGAYGVTENSAFDTRAAKTALDAARTSKWGWMQATGNKWVWGHDGNPESPRASLFGGAWFNGSRAGSRFAFLDTWPGVSRANLGARGRSDHLQPV